VRDAFGRSIQNINHETIAPGLAHKICNCAGTGGSSLGSFYGTGREETGKAK